MASDPQFGDLLWTPGADRATATAVTEFRVAVAQATGADLPDTRALHAWSVAHPDAFWEQAWLRLGVLGDRGEGPVMVAGERLSQTAFFPDARLNMAENLLRPDLPQDEVALVAYLESGERRELTRGELTDQSARFAATLRGLGVVAGDRVAAWLPNVPETVVAFLGAATVGAVFSSASPDFGVPGVLDRFGQIAPKVLVVADGYLYNGKRFLRLDAVPEVIAGLPNRPEVFVVPVLGAALPDGLRPWSDTQIPASPAAPSAPASADLLPFAPSASGRTGADRAYGGIRAARGAETGGDGANAVATDSGSAGPAGRFERLPFDHPLVVLYSSGTTGIPKAIVHRAGGVLLKHLVEHRLHCDIRRGDRVFYYTTCGWMMWNWQVSALASGATLVMYDGSPTYPEPGALFSIAAAEGVTFFGTSAKYLDAIHKAGVQPGREHDLSTMRTVASTGSPLSPEGFGYVYDSIGADVHLASISGGTDIVGCFVLGDPTRPVHAGEIQAPALGLDVDVVDETGASLIGRPGVRGELVCRNRFPSMPVGFWGDDSGERFESAYFRAMPGMWTHGDFASTTRNGGFVIHGRSDATLNAGGVRIGTAEIYRQVEAMPEIAEALAIGQEWDGDTRIVLFVVPAAGYELTDELVATIKRALRERCSPRHVPARIVAVPDLPRTRSGKLAELAVRNVVHGRAVGNENALANPESLQHFRARPELRD